MLRLIKLIVSHLLAAAIGFAIGVYTLPILTAPKGPTAAEVESLADTAAYTGHFRRDLEGSDLLHWGEGEVSVGPTAIALMGRLAPGPAYKLYLTPEFVETEEDFFRIKDRSVQVADVQTFENFIVSVPESVDVTRYTAVVIWCESFSEFITAAKYR